MNLFIGNLNPETNAAGLRTLFSEFGEVVSSKVIMDNATGMSKGFGFVEMGDKLQGHDAMDNLDSTFFEGNIISVREAKQNNGTTNNRGGSSGGNRSFKPRTPRPGGYNSGGYNSGGSGGYNSNRS
jgi:RNA recognition motif-containing protein